MNKIRFVNEQETLGVLKLAELLPIVERAYIAQATGKTSSPQYINMKVGPNMVHFKAGYLEGSKYFALKYSGGFWGNQGSEVPVDPGYVIAHDARTGVPEIIFVDSGAITNYRTAAGGAVVVRKLSNLDSRTIGVIGTGVQARLQVEAALLVRPDITVVRVWGRNSTRVAEYLADMGVKYPSIEFVACQKASAAVEQVDILITTTASSSAIVKADWISSGTLIVAVGACAPDMQEHEAAVMKKAGKVYADSIDRCKRDGELRHALAANVITENQITGEIGELLDGTIPSRTRRDEIIFVDVVGLGVLDAAVAEHLCAKIC